MTNETLVERLRDNFECDSIAVSKGWRFEVSEQGTAPRFEYDVWCNPPPNAPDVYTEYQLCVCASKTDADNIADFYNSLPQLTAQIDRITAESAAMR